MGMPCEINSLLKLTPAQGYPVRLERGQRHRVQKAGYRILPMDVPILLVDEHWQAAADVRICTLVWEHDTTTLVFEIDRLYDPPVLMKG